MGKHQGGWLRAFVAAVLIGTWATPLLAGPMDSGGQFTVSESGAATYALPITVPPGTAGMEPKLALTYNSQGGNGLLGVGWSLSGLSAITRCPRTTAQDGAKGGVNFDANDRFCLDGQRLMLVSGVYGAAGSEYRTERDSFSKIVANDGTTGDPTWFKVWTKSGQVIEYGNTTDSRIEAQGKTQARVWAINKISDTKQNYLTFSYTEDAANGDYTPSRIDYTGNSATALTPNASVQFVYETRPDIVPLYMAGSLIKSTKRLTKVQTYVLNAIRSQYLLTYAGPRLQTVKNCDAAMLCLPPLTVVADSASGGFNTVATTSVTWGGNDYTWLGDFNGDGLEDIATAVNSTIYFHLSTASGVATYSSTVPNNGTPYVWGGSGYNWVGDFNGDGKSDIASGVGSNLYLHLSTGTTLGTQIFSVPAWGGIDYTWAGDFNGDGRTDIATAVGGNVHVYTSNGNGFDTQIWTVENLWGGAGYNWVGDFNGDGKSDIASGIGSNVYLRLSSGSGFITQIYPLSNWGGVGYNWTGDFNGDGKTDIAAGVGTNVYIHLSTGSGFVTQMYPIASWGGAGYNWMGDFNGDGKTDIAAGVGANVYLYLSTGSGFTTQTYPMSNWGGVGYNWAGDFNGDGKSDIASGVNQTIYVRNSLATLGNLAVSFNSGVGSVANVTYKPLTNSSVYTKGTGSAYPLVDLQIPLYVVSQVQSSNGIGGMLTTDYQYGSLKAESGTGRGLLGFGWVQATSADTHISVRTDYRQDWPYVGLPSQVKKTLPGSGNAGTLSLVSNTFACVDPTTGVGCIAVAGNRYFPYLYQSVESNWDVNGAALPVVTTTNAFDRYGNATIVEVVTNDNYSKTTTNTYSNDTTNWYLGRLVRSQVYSTTPGTGAPTPPPPAGGPIFAFNVTLAANTTSYNLKVAAIAAGWNPIQSLVATVSVNSGVVIGSASAATPAFDTGSGLPAGSSLTLINNGSILGKGGAGGTGNSGTGGAGGPALAASYPISITNNGTIAGGGGGGGGGGSGLSGLTLYGGGGGGGGRGYTGGAGGAGGFGGVGGTAGTAGTSTTAGTGGVGAGNGGNGGNLGAAGTAGAISLAGTSGAGGAGGACTVGNANITWTAVGTRYGALN